MKNSLLSFLTDESDGKKFNNIMLNYGIEKSFLKDMKKKHCARFPCTDDYFYLKKITNDKETISFLQDIIFQIREEGTYSQNSSLKEILNKNNTKFFLRAIFVKISSHVPYEHKGIGKFDKKILKLFFTKNSFFKEEFYFIVLHSFLFHQNEKRTEKFSKLNKLLEKLEK